MMTDREIIIEAYAEVVKEFYKRYQTNGDVTEFKRLMDRARVLKDKALGTL